VETIIEEGRGKQAEAEGEAGGELLDDLPWGKTSLVGIGPSQVEVELVEGDLGHELGAAAESFQVEELVFDEAMDGLDLTLVGVGAGRNALMLGAEVSDGGGKVRTRAVGLERADELAAVVGLPGDIAQVDAAALQVSLDALGEEFAGLSGAARGVSEELQATAHLAGGVLDDRQAARLHLRPVVRDIVEVLGVGGDLLEQRPGLFHRREVLLLLVLATAARDQAVLAQNAREGRVTQGQFPFALQAPGAESRELAAQIDHALGQRADDLVGTGVRGAREFLQSLQPLPLVPPQPLAHGGDGGAEGAGCGLEAVLTGVRD